MWEPLAKQNSQPQCPVCALCQESLCSALGPGPLHFPCFEAELAQEVVCSHPVKAMAKNNRVKALERATHA